MNHLSLVQLQEVMAGEASPEQQLHVTLCALCRGRIDDLKRVDVALREGPPERTSNIFTERVMRRLGLRSAPTITWMLFKNLAPAVALLLVSVIAVVALNYFGAFEGSGLQQSASNVQSASGWLASEAAKGTTAFTGWMELYFSFAFGKSSYGITAFVVLFLAALALVDRYLLMPMMRKRGM